VHLAFRFGLLATPQKSKRSEEEARSVAHISTNNKRRRRSSCHISFHHPQKKGTKRRRNQFLFFVLILSKVLCYSSLHHVATLLGSYSDHEGFVDPKQLPLGTTETNAKDKPNDNDIAILFFCNDLFGSLDQCGGSTTMESILDGTYRLWHPQ